MYREERYIETGDKQRGNHVTILVTDWKSDFRGKSVLLGIDTTKTATFNEPKVQKNFKNISEHKKIAEGI